MFGWFRKPPIRPTPPLSDYMVTVHVRLSEPLIVDDGTVVVGYYRCLGLRITPDARRALIESCVTDGTIAWDDTEVRTCDIFRAHHEVTRALRKPFGAGVWYKSGHAYYPETDDDSPGAEGAADPKRAN